jgi:hypothetical protein
MDESNVSCRFRKDTAERRSNLPKMFADLRIYPSLLNGASR